MSSEHDVDVELKQFLQKNGGKAVTFKALHAAMEDNIDGFMRVLKAAFGSHKAARVALEQRVTALEARPAVGVEYAGTHAAGKSYSSGVLVTKKGGLWLSLRDTMQTPGMDPVSWKLVVKSKHAEEDAP